MRDQWGRLSSRRRKGKNERDWIKKRTNVCGKECRVDNIMSELEIVYDATNYGTTNQ